MTGVQTCALPIFAQTEHVVIDILDSVTLQRLQSLGVPRQTVEHPGALAFSPDGRMLSCASSVHPDEFVSTWDLQTGGLASRIALPQPDCWCMVDSPSITYSMSAKMVGVLRLDISTAIISVIDVVSGVHIHDVYPDTRWTYGVWAHGESLRFATAVGAAISIWEVEFAGGATWKIETLSLPDDAKQVAAFDFDLTTNRYVRRTKFFPYRLAFTRTSPGSTDELLVWDPRNSVPQLHETSARWHPGMSFSSGGRFFA